MSRDAYLKRLRALCAALPETSEKQSWGHPNFAAGGRLFAAVETWKGRPSLAFAASAIGVNANGASTRQLGTVQRRRARSDGGAVPAHDSVSSSRSSARSTAASRTPSAPSRAVQ